MLDCSKELLHQMPYEAYQCFLDADIWKTVGTNSRRMWADFISTTIGEWLEIIVVVVFVPAELASYFLPLTFCSVL